MSTRPTCASLSDSFARARPASIGPTHYLTPACPLDLAELLTAFLLAIYGSDYSSVSVPLRITGVAAALLPRTYRRFAWLAASLVLAWGTMGRIYFVDNHKVLLCYWCILLSSRTGPGSVPYIRRATQLTIGLVFLLATLWKVFSPDVMDGRLLIFMMLTDPRFAGFTSFVGGVSPQHLAENRQILGTVYSFTVQAAELHSGHRISIVASAMTFYTVLIEGLVAVFFLLTFRRRSGAARNALLMAFVLTVYSVATVIGFAWILCIMGLAQVRATERWTSAAYLASFALSQAYLLPWSAVL